MTTRWCGTTALHGLWGGTLMPETYLARGLSLTESGTGDKGTYDPATGKITWLKADGTASTMGPWTRSGAPPQRKTNVPFHGLTRA